MAERLKVIHLFHRHTAELPPCFRPAAGDVLLALIEHPDRTPIILTNSLGDKVRRHLKVLPLDGLDDEIAVLGDTRQYEMVPDWPHRLSHPQLGEIQVWPVSEEYRIDLRRPVYYRALVQAAADGSQLVVVADTLAARRASADDGHSLLPPAHGLHPRLVCPSRGGAPPGPYP